MDLRSVNLNSAFLQSSFIDINGTLFFVAEDSIASRALYKTDGTAEGTILFNGAWKPSTGETVPQWLRAFARGERQL